MVFTNLQLPSFAILRQKRAQVITILHRSASFMLPHYKRPLDSPWPISQEELGETCCLNQSLPQPLDPMLLQETSPPGQDLHDTHKKDILTNGLLQGINLLQLLMMGALLQTGLQQLCLLALQVVLLLHLLIPVGSRVTGDEIELLRCHKDNIRLCYLTQSTKNITS